MAEPLDPAAPGVASALKSLRTRVGLREERLHGTELALDTLTGLDSVRALINAGEAPERAIVRVVRAAAGTLEPTMSIVADASLALELSADLVPDTDLYAHDLGQRRDALLRNWERLHGLRSVPPSKAPSPRALRLEVESEALAALAMALTRVTDYDQLPAGPFVPGAAQAREPRSAVAAVSPAELQVFGAEFTRRSVRAVRPSSRPLVPSTCPLRRSPGGRWARTCRRTRRPAHSTSASPPGARSRTSSSRHGASRTARDDSSSRYRRPAGQHPPCSRHSS